MLNDYYQRKHFFNQIKLIKWPSTSICGQSISCKICCLIFLNRLPWFLRIVNKEYVVEHGLSDTRLIDHFVFSPFLNCFIFYYFLTQLIRHFLVGPFACRINRIQLYDEQLHTVSYSFFDIPLVFKILVTARGTPQ